MARKKLRRQPTVETRGAIRPHTTPTTDEAWDGAAATAECPADEEHLREMNAWVDPDGDPEIKSSYKFPHHECSGGKVGAANTRACIAGIAVLNGARGGADIPEADRAGVYRHLARHLEDADLEAPPLRARQVGIERRTLGVSRLEVREQGAARVLHGHAAMFEQLSEPILWFREKIARGAFAASLLADDIRALWNHNPDYPLGRNRAGTLRLHEDSTGLAVEIEPPDTSWARDLMVSIERGDVSQMSFGFQTIDDEWSMQDGEQVRTLKTVRLFDVSAVTFPAYPQTDVSARSLAGVPVGRLCEAYERLSAGTMRSGDLAVVQEVVRGLAVVAGPSPTDEIDILRRRLELAARLG